MVRVPSHISPIMRFVISWLFFLRNNDAPFCVAYTSIPLEYIEL